MKTVRRESGYTLVEIALVLVVIGVILAALFQLLPSTVRKERGTMGKDVVRSLRQEVIGYAMMYGRLPVEPAEVGTSTDPWNRALRYVAEDALQAEGGICDRKSTTLRVVFDGRTVYNVGFVVSSDGHDGVAGVDYDDPDIVNIDDKGDDEVEFVTLNQLKANVYCGEK